MDELEKEWMAAFNKIAKSFGLDDLSSKVVSVLYLEPEEVPMEDLAKKTGYSLASISNTMRVLGNMGFVQRIKKPGTKKIYFQIIYFFIMVFFKIPNSFYLLHEIKNPNKNLR